MVSFHDVNPRFPLVKIRGQSDPTQPAPAQRVGPALLRRQRDHGLHAHRVAGRSYWFHGHGSCGPRSYHPAAGVIQASR
jgi:hypothetical protein